MPTGFYSTYEELKLEIACPKVPFIKEFLQYLWGIETKDHARDGSKNRGFLQYLWGIETA